MLADVVIWYSVLLNTAFIYTRDLLQCCASVTAQYTS